jgi:hypothetical protein
MVEPGTLIAICIGIGAIMATVVTATGILLAPVVSSSDENHEEYIKYARNSMPYPYIYRGYLGSSASFRRV